eukprot:2145158-Lingulodinium_polyedra.AAC.1
MLWESASTMRFPIVVIASATLSFSFTAVASPAWRGPGSVLIRGSRGLLLLSCAFWCSLALLALLPSSSP